MIPELLLLGLSKEASTLTICKFESRRWWLTWRETAEALHGSLGGHSSYRYSCLAVCVDETIAYRSLCVATEQLCTLDWMAHSGASAYNFCKAARFKMQVALRRVMPKVPLDSWDKMMDCKEKHLHGGRT